MTRKKTKNCLDPLTKIFARKKKKKRKERQSERRRGIAENSQQANVTWRKIPNEKTTNGPTLRNTRRPQSYTERRSRRKKKSPKPPVRTVERLLLPPLLPLNQDTGARLFVLRSDRTVKQVCPLDGRRVPQEKITKKDGNSQLSTTTQSRPRLPSFFFFFPVSFPLLVNRPCRL